MSDPQRPNGLQPPGSSIHGIFQARVLEWVAIAFSRDGLFLWVCKQSDTTEQLSLSNKLWTLNDYDISVVLFLVKKKKDTILVNDVYCRRGYACVRTGGIFMANLCTFLSVLLF